jgi:hypothetical protein
MQDLQQAAQLFSDQGDIANYQQSLNALNKLQESVTSAESERSLEVGIGDRGLGIGDQGLGIRD